jgi:hypothetical protein
MLSLGLSFLMKQSAKLLAKDAFNLYTADYELGVVALQIIPSPLVRRLAMQKLRLTDEEDEEDENENVTYAEKKGKDHQTSSCKTMSDQ